MAKTNVAEFFRQVRQEASKVTWPTRKETTVTTGMVLLMVVIAAIFFAGQIAEGNFLTPRLVGDRVGLHPVWVIFALLAGGALFGFVGVLLAVPVAATAGVLVRFLLQSYLDSDLYQTSEQADTSGDDGAR